MECRMEYRLQAVILDNTVCRLKAALHAGTPLTLICSRC